MPQSLLTNQANSWLSLHQEQRNPLRFLQVVGSSTVDEPANPLFAINQASPVKRQPECSLGRAPPLSCRPVILWFWFLVRVSDVSTCITSIHRYIQANQPYFSTQNNRTTLSLQPALSPNQYSHRQPYSSISTASHGCPQIIYPCYSIVVPTRSRATGFGAKLLTPDAKQPPSTAEPTRCDPVATPRLITTSIASKSRTPPKLLSPSVSKSDLCRRHKLFLGFGF